MHPLLVAARSHWVTLTLCTTFSNTSYLSACCWLGVPIPGCFFFTSIWHVFYPPHPMVSLPTSPSESQLWTHPWNPELVSPSLSLPTHLVQLLAAAVPVQLARPLVEALPASAASSDGSATATSGDDAAPPSCVGAICTEENPANAFADDLSSTVNSSIRLQRIHSILFLQLHVWNSLRLRWWWHWLSNQVIIAKHNKCLILFRTRNTRNKTQHT